MTGPFPRERWLRLGLLATLVLLIGHALFYRLLCDDAFISFRYAHNSPAPGRVGWFHVGAIA